MFEDNSTVVDESEETQDVADPDEQESEENQDVADPETEEPEVNPDEGDTEEDTDDADRAFAQMRRDNADKESRIAELEAQLANANQTQNHYQEVFRQMGYEGDDPSIVAEADRLGIDPNDLAEYYAEERVKSENEEKLRTQSEEIANLKAERIANGWVARLHKVYPEINAIEDIPQKFWDMVDVNEEKNTPEDVMFMVKALENKDKRDAPKPIGKVNEPAKEKNYFTEEEVDAMSDKTKIDNHDKIMKSMKYW